MSNILIRAVRSLFFLTSRDRAMLQSKRTFEDYMKLAKGLSLEKGAQSILVPPMRGIDQDMRNWSFYMILEHNSIVNSTITATIQQLSRGESLSGRAIIDPKTDVMPSISAGSEQMPRFERSVIEIMPFISQS